MASGSKGRQAVLDPEGQETSGCQHHWVIERPAGPTSRGVCRNCADEKDFENYIEGSSWRYDVSPDQLAGGSRIPGVKVSNSKRNADEEEDA